MNRVASQTCPQTTLLPQPQASSFMQRDYAGYDQVTPSHVQAFRYDFSQLPVHSPTSGELLELSLRDNELRPFAGPLTDPAVAALQQPDAGMDAGGADAGTPAAPTFPTYAQIIANATVSAELNAAWAATKAATTRTSRREQGFWIKYDTSSSGYTCAPTFTGPSVGPDETGAADPGTKPADSGTLYTVGLFHTHTPMTYRTGGTRDVGPSGADNRFHTANNVAGIVYDYTESPAGSGSIPAGHPLNSAAQLYSSGPTQRT